MEISNDPQGVDSLPRSALISQRDESTDDHDVEKQANLNNSASDIPTHDIATQDEKDPQDPNIVDWDGPDDPENPLNWASSKKLAAMTIVSLVTMLS